MRKRTNLLGIVKIFMLLAFISVFAVPVTVSADSEHFHSDRGDSFSHPGWTAVSNESDLRELFKSGGRGYLTGDVIVCEETVTVSSDVELCLNDYSLTYYKNGIFIDISEGNSLILYDANDNSGVITISDDYQGTAVKVRGSFYMYGGNISGINTNDVAAGVYVDKTGKFEMHQGTISNNHAYSAGGVINWGKFIMDGGSIIDNTAHENSGGVLNAGSFMMYGGDITGNKVECNLAGGVRVLEGTFIIDGGQIVENESPYAGGIYVEETGSLIMNSGNVWSNKAQIGGGIINEGSCIINAGAVRDNTAETGGGVVSRGENSTFICKGYIIYNNAEYGAGILAEENTSVEVNDGSIFDNKASENGGGIFISDSQLILNNGMIIGNEARLGGGIYAFNGSSVEMNGGQLISNVGSENGGGIYFEEADFSIKSGEICQNSINREIDNDIYVDYDSTGELYYDYSEIVVEASSYNLNITYNPNGGSGKKYSRFFGNIDETDIPQKTYSRSGYSFYKWNTSEDGTGKSYNDKEKVKFDDNDKRTLNLYAQWIPKSFTVKFNANGGSGTMTSQTRKKNDNKELPENTFSYTGYIFKGWNTKADGSGTFYSDKTNENIEILNKKTITLYAQWEAKTDIPYKVEHYKQKLDGTYNKKASETESFTGTTGTSVTPEVKTYKGFSSPVTKSVKIKGNGTTVVKYYYERNSYTLTWDFAGGTAEGTYTSGSVKYGEAITAPVPIREGYTFNGWKTAVPEKMPAKNLTIKALWTANISKVTVEHYRQKVDGSYPSIANETEVLEGKVNSSITPSVKTYKGFTAPATKTVKIKADGSVVVKYNYTRNSYKLTWDFAGGKASGTYSKGTVIYGSKITAPVPVRDGYAFTGWDKTVPAKMPANDVTYKAKWRKLTNEEQVRNFVSRFYTIILDRPADEAGLNDWTNRLITKKAAGADVAAGFINSDEFQKKKMTDEEYVTKLYRAFFDREPDKAGYDGWLKELKNGKSRDYVLRGFINSVEFNNLCKKYGINAGSY